MNNFFIKNNLSLSIFFIKKQLMQNNLLRSLFKK